MNKKVVVSFLVMVIVAVAAVGGFYALSKYANKEEPEVSDTSELGKLLNKDLESSYPETPREVVKFYNRINSMMYNDDEVTEKQFEGLLNQMRMLFDEELLAENDFEKQLEEFKKDKQEYKKHSKTIVSYNMPENSSVDFYKVDNDNMASLDVSYMLKENGEYSKMSETFVLRQDLKENWKIVGWSVTEAADEQE